MSIAVDTAGNLLIADTGNNAIRFINHATGLISTIAGTATTAADADITLGDGGPARSAVLWNPRSIILDKDSNVYIADTYHHKIRMIDGDGVITTVAGTGIAGCAGDGLVATDAELNLPAALAVNQAGDIAIADAHVIRLIAHDTHRIETLAGMNECEDSTSSRSGSAIGETLLNPMGLSFDKSGQILYVSDSLHNLVRQINLSTRAMTTAAGIEPGRMVASNGSISATDVAINIPVGLAVDSGGALYIAQAADSRISFVSFPSAPPSKPPSVCTVQTGRTNKALHSFVIQAYCQ
jgi:DNA-binding beta-propeller fold protein YncE